MTLHWPTDASEWQAWVAGVAALISVLAALYSGKQARSAKRQADAAHGDVDPTFDFIEMDPDSSAICWFQILARNFNRHSIQMLEARVIVPNEYVVADNDEDLRDRSKVDHLPSNRVVGLNSNPASLIRGIAPNSSSPTEANFRVYVIPRMRPLKSAKIHVQIKVAYRMPASSQIVRKSSALLLMNIPVATDWDFDWGN